MDKQMRGKKRLLKKEGRDAEGRMGGGYDDQERKTLAIAVWDCVEEAHARGSDRKIHVLNDGSRLTFPTSFPLFL